MKPHVLLSPKSKAILEVLIGLFLFFGYIWLVYPLYKRYWLHVVFIAMMVGLLNWSRFSRREGCRELGLRWDNWICSGKVLFAVTAVSLLVLIAVWSLFYPIDLQFYRDSAFWLRLIQYPLWALFQQYIALVFFFRRFREVFHHHLLLAIVASAMTFSAAHIPNPPLMLFTFLGGLFWSWVYHKWQNLFTIAISHAVLGLTCCSISMVYSVVGPFADIRWSKEHPLDYRICIVNGKAFSHKMVLPVSKTSGNTICVEGLVRAVKGQVDKVFVRFGRRDYQASYGPDYQNPKYGRCGFHAAIPITGLKPGYYRLCLKVSLRNRFFCHYPSRRMWIKIQ